MPHVSLTLEQIYERNEVYCRYRETVDSLDRTVHPKADALIANAVESSLERFLSSKSADAQGKEKSIVEKSNAEIQEKIRLFQNQGQDQGQGQGQGQCELPEAVTQAQDQFTNQVGKAQFTFKNSMSQAIQAVIKGVRTDPKYKIEDLKNSHLNSVNRAWDTFNKELNTGIDGDLVSEAFESNLRRAKREFESSKKNFIKGLEDLGNDEFERSLTQAVGELERMVLEAQATFFGTIDALIKEEGTNDGSNFSTAPACDHEAARKIPTKLRENGQNPAEFELMWAKLGKILSNIFVREAFETPAENCATLEKLVQDVAKISQRLDGLEKKIQEMSSATCE